MYKDKKGVFVKYRHNRGVLIIIGISVTCLIYVLFKMFSTTDSATVDYQVLMEDVSVEYQPFCANIFKSNSSNIDPKIKWSTSFEDWFLYHNIFKKEKIALKRNRTYLDIGNYMPYEKTASAFFDVCLGWYGLCIWSPDLATNRIGRSDRSCNTINKECLWTADTKFLDGHDDAFFCKNPNRFIQDILNEYKFMDKKGNQIEIKNENNIIDFVSIRIEGAELSFLKCWPFHLLQVEVFMIGTITSYQSSVTKFMLANGYYLTQILSHKNEPDQMIFVPRSEDIVNPWNEQNKHEYIPEDECKMIKPDADDVYV